MSIVVLTRGTTAIDLSASILNGIHKTIQKVPQPIEWIVEKEAKPHTYERLQSYAAYYKCIVPVTVKKQEEIAALCPSRERIITILRQILNENRIYDGVIRIHHGSIDVMDESKTLHHFHYFGISNGELVLYEGKKKPFPFRVEAERINDIYFSGSMNLLLLQQYGTLAHLPWYCIDSNIEEFVVEEYISPPEGCSQSRFKTYNDMLLPTGYSIFNYDFKSNPEQHFDSLVIEKWLSDKGAYTPGRKKDTVHFVKTIISSIAHDQWILLSTNGFSWAFERIKRPSRSATDRIKKSLLIHEISKLIIAFEEGFFDQIRIYQMLTDNNELLISKEIICQTLVEALIELDSDYFSAENSFSLEAITAYRPFAAIKHLCFEYASSLFCILFNSIYYDDKATVEKFLSITDNPQDIYTMITKILADRKDHAFHHVKGSIFEHDTRFLTSTKVAKNLL